MQNINLRDVDEHGHQDFLRDTVGYVEDLANGPEKVDVDGPFVNLLHLLSALHALAFLVPSRQRDQGQEEEGTPPGEVDGGEDQGDDVDGDGGCHEVVEAFLLLRQVNPELFEPLDPMRLTQVGPLAREASPTPRVEFLNIRAQMPIVREERLHFFVGLHYGR